jgi:carbohydrate kinase (thermoresistant glucokinase family)
MPPQRATFMDDKKSAARFCALILMGVSGSGKSTIAIPLAKRLGWMFKDGDDFHSPGNIEKMRAGHPLTDDDRWPWLHAIAAEIARDRARGASVVIACSALKRAYRDVLVAGHDDVRIVYLKGDRALIGGRLAKRKGHFMPAGLLDSQFGTLEEPGREEHPIVVDISLPVEKTIDDIVTQLGRSDGVSA